VTFEPTWESVSTHELPSWYDDAKLGVFIHWGLYSVPGWAEQVPDIQEMLITQGPKRMLSHNPYAEWYRNTMQIKGSPTWQHHRDTYGVDFEYDDFIPAFNEGTRDCDLDAIAAVAESAGARYLVMTTKHHEGFALWPANTPHPTKGEYHADRDLVGGLSEAVKTRGIRMGLYYSGGYDWPVNDAVMVQGADAVLAAPTEPEYVPYVTSHVSELIERYKPSLLWNDIGWPKGGDLAALFAQYYNAVPDGVINDRWIVSSMKRSPMRDALLRLAGRLLQGVWRFLPADKKRLTFPGAQWYDFTTPEYEVLEEIREKKWESTRGVGHSFGANRNERPEDIVTATELIRSFCDIVSKNGNLLIGIGPNEHGAIPEEQAIPLRGLGDWLSRNGEAIYATRPWDRASTVTSDGTEVRFTAREGVLYALLLDRPATSTFLIEGIDAESVSEARLLGTGDELVCTSRDGVLELTLPESVPQEDAYAVRLGAGVRWIS
jgi:alpha-L-fucosidase